MPATEPSTPSNAAANADAATAAGAHAAYADDLYCPECGYSLRGLTSDRCPECGLDLGFIESAESLIPWERRREIGRFRAYWRTVWLATFRPKRLCRAAYQPVSYRDAQLFRWLTVTHAFAALLAVVVTLQLLGGAVLDEAVEETGWWFVCFVGLCAFLALAAFTGVPSYFFHPRWLPVERQNRAVALSYYGCAGLAVAPIGAVLACTGVVAARPYLDKEIGDQIILVNLVSILFSLAAFVACWICWARMARYLLMRAGRRLAVTWLMPLLSLVAAALILIGLPAVAYFLALVYFSLFGAGLLG